MMTENDIYSISKSKRKKAVFEICLEEACRQWCDFIDEDPERRNGEGFSNFFYEIFDDKWKEYLQDLIEDGKYPQKTNQEQER